MVAGRPSDELARGRASPSGPRGRARRRGLLVRTSRSIRVSERGIATRSSPPPPIRREGPRRRWSKRRALRVHAWGALATDEGAGALLASRQWMVEPVFGDIKAEPAGGAVQTSGAWAAVRSEWRLITATHNLLQASPPTDWRSPRPDRPRPRPRSRFRGTATTLRDSLYAKGTRRSVRARERALSRA